MTVQIKAREFLRDIEMQMDDSTLMVKYGLSPQQLQRLFQQLISMNLISEGQLKVRSEVSDSQITRAFVEAQRDIEEMP